MLSQVLLLLRFAVRANGKMGDGSLEAQIHSLHYPLRASMGSQYETEWEVNDGESERECVIRVKCRSNMFLS